MIFEALGAFVPLSCSMVTSRFAFECLHGASILVFAYLCAGELLPCTVPLDHLPAPMARAIMRLLADWDVQQVIILSLLSGLAMLMFTIASFGGWWPGAREPRRHIRQSLLLGALNLVPIMAAFVTMCWYFLSGNCPDRTSDQKACAYQGLSINTVGIVSGRLARIDLGICLLASARGDWSLMFGATGLGFSEAMPLHRLAGFWCAGQSALHSVAFLLYYLHTNGLQLMWLNCFPLPRPDSTLNALGLVNGLGILAFLGLLALISLAIPCVRQRYYHVFQWSHLPLASLFTICSALHDLPILIFAVPGLAGWCLEFFGTNVSNRSPQLLPAKARLLSGTSGPWIELTIVCTAGALQPSSPAPHWVWLRVVPLGRERHPFSVAAVSSTNTSTEINVIVTARAGDWSQSLVDLCQESNNNLLPGLHTSIGVPHHDRNSSFVVEVSGPYLCGGHGWSLGAEDGGHVPELLVVAGGTGITKWLSSMVSIHTRAAICVCGMCMCGCGCVRKNVHVCAFVCARAYITQMHACTLKSIQPIGNPRLHWQQPT